MSTIEETIDQEIFRFFEKWKRQMKVAMVIASVHSAVKDGHPETTHQMIADRIGVLVANGQLTAFGNVENWRRSEINLAEQS